VVTDSVYGRNWWEPIPGIVGTDSGAEPVAECSTSRNRIYSLVNLREQLKLLGDFFKYSQVRVLLNKKSKIRIKILTPIKQRVFSKNDLGRRIYLKYYDVNLLLDGSRANLAISYGGSTNQLITLILR
jgi:hypothetical protein